MTFISNEKFQRQTLRLSTLAAREAASSTPAQRSSRGILSSPTTASLYSEHHDCSKINQENTYVKTTARCLFTIFRFYVSYAFSWTPSEGDSADVPPLPKTEGENLSNFSCTTLRGPTNFQGAQSHCKSLCQAAHSALTPNLQDNTFTLSRALIKAHPYYQLPLIQQMLVERCLRLTPSDIEELNDPSQAKREEFLLRHTHPSFRLLHAGAFAANSVGYGRNVTFEGPTPGNRIDCHLESKLRGLEDKLSQECTEGTKHPKAALQEFHAAYLVCLQELEERLVEVSTRTAALQAAETDLEEAEARLQNSLEKKDDLISINRDNYRDKVSKYLEHWEAFSKFKGKGIPECYHKQITDSLKKHFSPFILYGIKDLLLKGTPPMDYLLKSQLSVMTTYRHKPPVSSPNWNAWTDELFLRQDEVSHQKHILSLGFEEMYKLCKMDIFPKDENGNWISPSRLKMAEALIERMESPQRPPIRKRKRDPSDAIIQPQEQESNFESPGAKKSLFPDTLSEDKSEEEKSPEAPPARKRKTEPSEITEPQEGESNFKSPQMKKNLFLDTLSEGKSEELAFDNIHFSSEL